MNSAWLLKNRYVKLFYLALVLGFSTSKILACTCSTEIGEFCHGAIEDSYIVLAELIAFEDFSAAYFKVIENLTDLETPDTLHIIGADGWTCGVNLEQFVVGDSLILNVSYSDTPYQNISNGNYYNWHLWACWRSYLHFSNGKVRGPFTTLDEHEVNYDDFKLNLGQCFDFLARSIDENSISIDIHPNPFTQSLNIRSKDIQLEVITLLDMHGNRVMKSYINSSNALLDVNSLSSGIYFIIISSDKGIIRRKLIKI